MWYWLKNLFRKKQQFTATQDLVTFFQKDVNKIAEWLSNNVWYWSDRTSSDEWQSATRTLERMKADCEDFAVLWHDIFRVLEWEANIYCGYPKKGIGHAICVAKAPKNWGYVYTSNDSIIQVNSKSYEEVVKIAMPDMVHYRRTDVLGLTIGKL